MSPGLLRQCRICRERKPLDEFHKYMSRGKEMRRPECGACRSEIRRSPAGDAQRDQQNARKREKYANDPLYRARVQEANRKFRFGLTSEEVDAIFESQGRKCAVCGTTEVGEGACGWQVDHDHRCCPGIKSCGKCVRGILCQGCNMGIGQLGDDADRCLAAASYLWGFQDLVARFSNRGPQLSAGISRQNPVAGT